MGILLKCISNKSPKGLNAHLNLHKLPVVHVINYNHLNNSESPTPKDDSY